MKKRHFTLITICLLLLTGAVALSLASTRELETPYATAREVEHQPEPERPVEVVYSAFFHFVVDLQKQADELEAQGHKGESLRLYVQTSANLNDDDGRKLNKVASACVRDVAMQDAKAFSVIQTFRSQFPGGRIPKGVTPPPPPPELKVLQQERNAIILAAKDRLIGDLGEAAFNKVDAFLENRFAPGVAPLRKK